MAGMEQVDDFLKKYVQKYDQWLAADQVDFTSKVIPVNESLHPTKWVLPSAQVLELLEGVTAIALADCRCRAHYLRCDKPLDVCLVFNKVADHFVANGLARFISAAEAVERLKRANETGLVHLTLYMPDREIYALCSCCPCCCHDLQLLKRHNRSELVARADFIAAMADERCTSCGRCVERCPFDARAMTDGRLEYNRASCFGCGLCVTTCEAGAVTMEPARRGEG